MTENEKTTPAAPLLSAVVPVYRGAAMLDDTFAQLVAMEKQLGGARLEIIAVDDGSDDDSYAKILQNQEKYPGKIRAVKLARNYGAIAATLAGTETARGGCIANIPQDLQEPPELFARMFAAWQEGVKINIGVRQSRQEPAAKKIPAALYHRLFRALVAPDYPTGGLCAYLIDRQIAAPFCKSLRWGMDPATILFRMGFSRRLHFYDRKDSGAKSNWTLAKNAKLAIDNFTGFSYLPVRLISLAGLLVSLASFAFAAYVLVGKLTEWYPISQPPGWATIIVLLTLLSGMTMLMLGVIGEYLWRTLDAVRDLPPYQIEEVRD